MDAKYAKLPHAETRRGVHARVPRPNLAFFARLGWGFSSVRLGIFLRFKAELHNFRKTRAIGVF